MELAVLVLPLPIEGGRRVAQVDAENLVYGAEGLLLGATHLVQAALFGVDAPDVAGALAHLVVESGVHSHRVAGAFGLGHYRLGYDAVLPHEADEHIPLAAVAEGLVQQPGHHPVVNRAVSSLDDSFQDVIGPFHLVPEHHVALAELELLDVEQVLGFRPEQVQAGEHPAAAGAGLVGYAPVVQNGGKGVHRLCHDIAVESHVVHVVLRDHVLH